MPEILFLILLVCCFGVVAWYVHKWTAADETGYRRFYASVTAGLCMLALFIGAERLVSVEGIGMMLLCSAVIFRAYKKMSRQHIA